MAHVHLISIVNPRREDGAVHMFPWAVASVLTELQKTAHSFDVVDTHLHGLGEEELLDHAEKNFHSKYYGISAYTEGYRLAKLLAALIRRKRPDAVIIVGGLLAFSDECLFKNTEVDIAVTAADGQYVLPEILDTLESGGDIKKIAGLSVMVNGEVFRSPVRPIVSKEAFPGSLSFRNAYQYFAKEMDQLVSCVKRVTEHPVKPFPILTSRGCPFECTFCAHSYGRALRRLERDHFFDEIQHLIDTYGIDGVYGHDSNAFLNEKDVDEYCRIYDERGCTFKMTTRLRAFGDARVFQKMADHGVIVGSYGFESGCQEMLDVIRKGIKVSDYEKVVVEAAKTEMIFYSYFMFGMPGECRRTVQETREFMFFMLKHAHKQKKLFAERKTPYICTSGFTTAILIPLPLAEVFERAVGLGMIGDMDAYLSYLGRKTYSKRFVNSRNIDRGGDINLSDFPSREALVHYVHYSEALVRLRALFLEFSQPFKEWRSVLMQSKNLTRELASYYLSVFKTFFVKNPNDPTAEQKRELKRMLKENDPPWSAAHNSGLLRKSA